MLALILDGQTAVNSAREGIRICLQTVIPALFPFFLLSPILTGVLWDATPNIFKKIGKLCKIPEGCESLFLIGLLSGYPIGAQLISQAYQNGKISTTTAHRMMGFCNNAGPAFIFGMLSSLFTNSFVPWVLWSIHILSAILVGIILPGKREIVEGVQEQEKSISITEILQNTIKTMATVCGWVLIFRVILGFFNKWVFCFLPDELQIVFAGFMELANGCVALNTFSNEYLRFVLASVFLSFGGLCVGMQTASVAKNPGLGMYFPGKVLQTLFSFTLSYLISPVLYPQKTKTMQLLIVIFLLIMVMTIAIKIVQEKSCSFWKRNVV